MNDLNRKVSNLGGLAVVSFVLLLVLWGLVICVFGSVMSIQNNMPIVECSNQTRINYRLFMNENESQSLEGCKAVSIDATTPERIYVWCEEQVETCNLVRRK